MDSQIFTTWMKKVDNKMTIRGKCKIVMVMDNCPAHPTVPGLKSIKQVFLPPNTTSITQPMDQGIIQNIKVHYRHLFVKRGLLPAMEKKEPVSWTLLDCLTALKDSWNDVKPSTIQNCFLHCGFKTQTPPLEDDDPEDDLPLAQLRSQSQSQQRPS